MKIRDLIELLMKEDHDMEVRYGYNYGDRARTTVAPEVRRVEVRMVAMSRYHDEFKVLNRYGDEYVAVDDSAHEVVVLS